MKTMMDKTTLHFIACESCEEWFQLRTLLITKLLFALGVMLAINLKDSGTVSKITLSLVLEYTLNLDHLIKLVYCMFRIESFMVMMERLFVMQKIPQEIQEGNRLQNWPEKGCIEFKDVYLRYR